MKKYNLDQQLAQKFNERNITPSADAWERIAYKRQQKQAKKNKKPLWYTVAAILIIALGTFPVLFKKEEKPQIQVVEQNRNEKHIDELEKEQPFQMTEEAISSVHKPETITIYRPILQKNQHIDNPVEIEPVFTEPELQKANEVATAIVEIVEKKGNITGDEIDALLHNAQKELAIERLQNSNSRTDETALLKEAETEVDNSFREKTLGIAKLKYSTIKIAFKQ